MRVPPSVLAALLSGVLILGLGGCAAAPAQADRGDVDAAVVEPEVREYEPAEFMDLVTEAQTDAGSFRMTMEIVAQSTLSLDAALVLDNGGGQPGLDMLMETDGNRMAMRLVDDQSYVRIEPLTGEKYVHVDPADEGNPLRSIATQMASSSPIEQAKDVRGAATSVTRVGPDEVDGIATTRYTVTVDPGKVTGKTAESFGASLLGVDELVYDYWIDEADRPVQVVFSYDVGGTEMSSTMKMTDWAAVPPITAPPAEQLVTLEELGLVG